jgi:hypothetical protein
MHALIGNCRVCGYSLVRLTEPRCPECGTVFNPDDPRTMVIHKSRLADLLGKKTTLWTVSPAIVAGMAAIFLHVYFPETGLAISILAAVIVGVPTLYLLMARRNFRAYLRRKQREAERLARERWDG